MATAPPNPRPNRRPFPQLTILPSKPAVSVSSTPPPQPFTAASTLDSLQFPVFLGAVSFTQGAYGSVWGVEDNTPRIAVKVTKIADPDWLQMARNEYETLRMLSHPNVLSVHGFSLTQDRSTARLYMAYIQGKTLAELINQRKRLEEADYAAVVRGFGLFC